MASKYKFIREGITMDKLFELIASSVIDGELPRSFSLPDISDEEDGIKWADGAMDGVSIYHMGIPEISEDDLMLISDAVRAAGMKEYDLADRLFRMLGSHIRAVHAADDLRSYIIENKSKLAAENLYNYAIHLLFSAEDRESVKYALSMLELFKTDGHRKTKDAVRTIGLSDEFTLFAVLIMQHWKDGNNEIWQLARKVHGWGRIHAVERIEPDTEDIRHWLLTEGVHNDVMPAYSALTCWFNSSAEDILREGPSREEFTGIRDIIRGLLDEGPVSGFSELDNKDEIIFLFLDTAWDMELTLDDYKVIYEIFCAYREEFSDKCEIALVCKKFLHTYQCRCLLLDEVKQGRCIDMAADTGIDCSKYVTEQ